MALSFPLLRCTYLRSMRIAEIYNSIQGEGFLTGTDSIFVRASGCNLRCQWCDTRYASWEPEGDDISVEAILATVDGFDGSHVVVTGGEPMLFAELIPLCGLLRQAAYHITIETAGTLHLPVECDLMSISPKLANSTPAYEVALNWHMRHETTRHAPDVIRRLVQEHCYQLKFVIDEPADCEEVDRYLAGFPQIDRGRVLLMPQGTDAAVLEEVEDWLKPYCSRHGFGYCPRKQIEWFGLERRT